MNKKFCIFPFICSFFANHFEAVHKIRLVKGIVPMVEGLNKINLYEIYDLVTGPEKQIYVAICVQYVKLDNFQNALPSDSELLHIKVHCTNILHFI